MTGASVGRGDGRRAFSYIDDNRRQGSWPCRVMPRPMGRRARRHIPGHMFRKANECHILKSISAMFNKPMNKSSPLSMIDSPFNALLEVKTEEELFQSAAKLAKELGFDHFLFGLQVNASYIRPARSIYENYPREWWLKYNQNNYYSIDPVLDHCLTKTLPLIWTDEVFAGRAADMWEEAKSHGLNTGITLPMHNQAGITGLLSLARDGSRNFSASELATLVGQAFLFSCYLHDSATGLLVPKMISPGAAQLTDRERECLLWSAEGKTAWEIGQILGISERTVIFHLKNAFQKLGAKNKTQALVRAISMGLLSTDNRPSSPDKRP